jgi:ribose transport system substrate-binding protein
VRKQLCSGACVAVLAIAMVGCGSSQDENATTTSASTADQSAGVKEAATAVAALRKPPAPLEIPPLAQKPKAGTHVYAIGCPLPECAAFTAGVERATALIGWKLTVVKASLTPEGTAGAWDQAVAAKPAAIFSLPLGPTELIHKQIEAAGKNGTLVIMTAVPGKPADYGLSAIIGGTRWYDAFGTALANWAVMDSGGKADVVFLSDNAVATLVSATKAGQAELTKNCSACKSSVLAVQNKDSGKAIPGQVVSYLQKNPEVKYVIAPVSSNAIGISPALKSAGIDAKLLVGVAQPTDLHDVKSGAEAAAVTTEFNSLAYRMLDAAIRLDAGEALPPALGDTAGVKQLFDATNVANADTIKPWDVPDVEGTFATAWHVN